MDKLTLKGLLAAKGKRHLTQVYVRTPNEAAACEEAGVDMLVTAEQSGGQSSGHGAIRKAAPNTFLTIGLALNTYGDRAEVIRNAYRLMSAGADMLYCGYGIPTIRALAEEFIPVVGHVGLVPYRNSWFGGMKAVGKTAVDALRVYELTKQYEDAGAFAVEMELVPAEIATEISKRSNLLIIGMGAGINCDVQYLFATDILGDNIGHVPRHSKVYRDFKTEYERLHRESVEAFKEFRSDVLTGAYPAKHNDVSIDQKEYEAFLKAIG